MSLFVTAISDGLLFAFVAMGVFISYRIFKIPDMTTEGSFVFGASIAAALLTGGVHPAIATIVAGIGGIAAGVATGLLHTRFKINAIIAGIIVATGLYSINIYIMGHPSVFLSRVETLMSISDEIAPAVFGAEELLGMPAGKVAVFISALLTAFACAFILRSFFRTHLGLAMRASGDNERMIQPLGVNVNAMLILGLAMANGLIALGGALVAQSSAWSDVNMGIGQLVGGLGSVLIGKEIMSRRSFGWGIIGAGIGSVVFQLVIALVLSIGDFASSMRLATSLFLLAALLLPDAIRRLRASQRPTAAEAKP